jgi:hypothetical protein
MSPPSLAKYEIIFRKNFANFTEAIFYDHQKTPYLRSLEISKFLLEFFKLNPFIWAV